MYRAILFPLIPLLVIGCSQKPKPFGAFFLVEGSKIGKLEVTTNENILVEGEEPDSTDFDNKYLRKSYRISFRYPGNTITILKVYRDGKQGL